MLHRDSKFRFAAHLRSEGWPVEDAPRDAAG